MRGLGLSSEQIAARRNYVQAGDVAPIMEGRWNEIWRQKKGLSNGDDLSSILRVQMGSYTEPFGLAWCEQQTGREVEYFSGNSLMRAAWLHLTGREARSDELVVSKQYPWLACNLDALSTTARGHRTTLDQKHVSKADEATITRYTPGCTQQSIVCETDWWALSFFIGNSKWEWCEQERDPFYSEDVIEQTREFWRYVERDEEPVDKIEPLPAPKPQPKRHDIDLNGGTWIDNGNTFVPVKGWPNWSGEMVELMKAFEGTYGASVRHAITRDAIKKLVPEDVGKIERGHVVVKQDGRGITIALKEEK